MDQTTPADQILLAVTRLGPVDVAFDAGPIQQVLDADADADEEPGLADAVDLERLFEAPPHDAPRRAVSVRIDDEARVFVLGPTLEFRRVPREALRGVPPFLAPLRRASALDGFVTEGDTLSCVLDWRELARLGASPPA